MELLLNRKVQKVYSEINIPKKSKILANLLRISVPAALETFLISVVGLADTVMVGGVGTNALAAVSIAQQPVYISLAASVGFSAGVTAIVARRRGEKNQPEAQKVLRQAIILGLITSLIFAVLTISLARPFLILTGANEDTLDLSATYLQIVTTALVFNYLRIIICSALRAVGDVGTTLLTNMIANTVNIAFNYCLINGHFGFPALGVAGAAIATVIGNTVAFLISVFIIRYKKSFVRIKLRDDWRFDKECAKGIVTVSSSAFIEQIFMRIGFFMIAMIVNRLGTHLVAVNAIIAGIVSLSFSITDGFSIGVASLVGRSLGEKNEPLAFAYGRLSQILSFLIGLIMISLILTFRYQLSMLFSDDETVINDAANILRIAVFVVVPQSAQWVTTGILRGAGDIHYTARSAMLSIMIIRPVCSYLLCYPIGLGLLGSWIGMFIDQTTRFALNDFRFENLKWAEMKV
ncbi:MAG: MATE family efflux transporter [Bacilli bacterium]|jgi:putative MATE family efflux protein|nr:MAG: Multidrug resistance protein NorM [Tenericutes bacterium ADurb.Bin140]HRU49706.1 MATE family efflux transporter [Bacilli bacterium]